MVALEYASRESLETQSPQVCEAHFSPGDGETCLFAPDPSGLQMPGTLGCSGAL